jgi:hypothetical protein
MQRLLAIALLLVTGLPMAAPMFALSSGEAGLAACCRRNGAHHCSMIEAAERNTPMVRDFCPMMDGSKGWSHHAPFSLDFASLLFAGVVSHTAQVAQVEAWARVALDGARQKRGPPMVVPS